MQYTLLHNRTGQAINLEAAAPFIGPDFFGLESWEAVAAAYGPHVLPDFDLVPMHDAAREHRLRQSIRKARAQRDELASSIAALRRELRDNEEQNERLGAERDLLAEVIKDFRKDGLPIRPAMTVDGSVDLHATAERLTAQVDNQQRTIDKHIAGLDELGRGYAAMREKLEQAESDRGVLIAQKEMLERDLRQANRDLHATKQAAEMLKLDRTKLDNQCSALKTELELATREREAALKQLEKLEAKLESMGPIQEERDRLEADLQRERQKLEKLRLHAQLVTNERDELRTIYNQLEARLGESSDDHRKLADKLRAERDRLKHELKEAAEAMQAKLAELELSTREREAALKQLEKLEAKLESMPAAREAQTELGIVTAQRDVLRGKAERLEDVEIPNLRQQIKQLTDTLNEQRHANGLLMRKLDEAIRERNEARQVRDSMRDELSRLRANNEPQ
ncbi:MAG: hypothetical protein ACTHK7_18380 [Aureliella sp.]